MKKLFFILTFLFFYESIGATNNNCKSNELSKESSLIVVDNKEKSLSEDKKMSSIVNAKTAKFKGYIEQTMILPIDDDYKKLTRYGVEAIFGIQFKNDIYFGFGSGMLRWDSYYKNNNNIATSIPVFLNLRYSKNTQISPYVSLKLGGLLGTPIGGFINPTVGVRFKITDRAGANVGVGYNLTLVHEDYDSRNISREPNTLLHSLNFNVGIDF